MSKEVLVLGAGMISGPCVDYLMRNNFKVTVVSALPGELKHMSTLYPSSRVILVDIVKEPNKLGDLVSKHDIVISLLPDHLHRLVTTCCIDCKKNFVHVSYEGKDVRELDDRAKAAGITVLSEVGLDPGIDHLLAMSCIDSVRQQGGKVTGYISLCGGLPAPESSNGPLRYKFSWYPKGMMMSSVEATKYIKDDKLVEVPEGHAFDKPEVVSDLLDGYDLEYVPNGDASPYKEAYGIQSASTVYRGTLRYKGFSTDIKAIIELGLFSSETLSQLLPGCPRISWRKLICILLKLPQDSSLDEIRNVLHAKFGHSQHHFDTMVKLELISDEDVPQLNTPLDALCSLFTRKLAYEPKERDMVVMRTIILATLPNGQKQKHVFDLVEMGQANGFSAMAKTVGFTVAICACLIMEGVITRTGAILPVTSDIYLPVLDKLAKEGIEFKSSVVTLT